MTTKIPIIVMSYSDIVEQTKSSIKNSFYYQNKRHLTQQLHSMNNIIIGCTRFSNCNSMESKHVTGKSFILSKEKKILLID